MKRLASVTLGLLIAAASWAAETDLEGSWNVVSREREGQPLERVETVLTFRGGPVHDR